MKAYWKSQWPNIVVGLIYFVISICNFCSGDNLFGVAWMLSAFVWLIMSRVDYLGERIKILEKEVEHIKNRAITDIEEKSPNHFIVRRKLGPDKEEK